ncbi:MAG TPA: indolepyruvate oxidoreductase subunit beta [Bacteroidales bacterium]|nr:indolepyruvate oxidoreductase subunit beta [Bacteroidales bacterium]HNT70883.1 indolepyruvate oxidoreductase subunit beta [Bacteroidales bacterium]HOC40915.1 indolepyruvate oxidoreductase subunit beta [Bacteroidales bacterium]HOU82949.1 indolepyruvate oxidoreductase subunit beta [Bacteroidales bacterium]HPB20167.1 indolepyruvate oxidoreductase subunit beta [Bacteroidales bacterium]
MKKDIILAGVGGQGILSIATTIGLAALKKNLNIKQAEVHGMSQRGGEVVSHLRISDSQIFSDLITKGQADMILSLEPLETLRYLPYLNESGWIISNSEPYTNIPNYPDLEMVYNEIRKYKNHVLINADEIAKKLNAPLSANMVLIGAAAHYLGFEQQEIEDAIREQFNKKGDDIVNINIQAFREGLAFAKEYTKA